MKILGIKTSLFIFMYSLFVLQVHTLNCDKVV